MNITLAFKAAGFGKGWSILKASILLFDHWIRVFPPHKLQVCMVSTCLMNVLLLCSVCKSIKSWLDSEPMHVAVVHCKGGKGRTGCVIAAFMHYTEICHRFVYVHVGGVVVVVCMLCMNT